MTNPAGEKTLTVLTPFGATDYVVTGPAKSVGGANYLPEAGDFDGDGNDDLVFNDWTTNGGDTLWWGPGLSPAISKAVSLAVAQIGFAGDFDGDSRDDLFVNNYNAGGDSIWWGTSRSGFSTTDTGFAATAVTMTADYTYGVDGTRTTKQVNGGTVSKQTYTDDGSLPLLLRETSAAGSTYVVYGPGDQPIEQVNPDGTATWLHHDQLGSVRLATNTTNGTETSRRTFNAYGTVASQTTASGATQPLLGYAGQYTDTETGYQYLRARHYDPTTGQFLTIDPLVNVTAEPYGYVKGNPIAGSDPTGLCGPFGDGACPGGSLVPDAVSEPIGEFASGAWKHRDAIMNAAGVTIGVVLLVGTGGAATPFLIGASIVISGYQTYETCKEGVDGECAVSAIATAAGVAGVGVGYADDPLKGAAGVAEAMEYSYGPSAAAAGPLANLNRALGAIDVLSSAYGLTMTMMPC